MEEHFLQKIASFVGISTDIITQSVGIRVFATMPNEVKFFVFRIPVFKIEFSVKFFISSMNITTGCPKRLSFFYPPAYEI